MKNVLILYPQIDEVAARVLATDLNEHFSGLDIQALPVESLEHHHHEEGHDHVHEHDHVHDAFVQAGLLCFIMTEQELHFQLFSDAMLEAAWHALPVFIFDTQAEVSDPKAVWDEQVENVAALIRGLALK